MGFQNRMAIKKILDQSFFVKMAIEVLKVLPTQKHRLNLYFYLTILKPVLIGTIQSIYSTNQLTGFYIIGMLAANRLKSFSYIFQWKNFLIFQLVICRCRAKKLLQTFMEYFIKTLSENIWQRD